MESAKRLRDVQGRSTVPLHQATSINGWCLTQRGGDTAIPLPDIQLSRPWPPPLTWFLYGLQVRCDALESVVRSYHEATASLTRWRKIGFSAHSPPEPYRCDG
jgi:hypothetical protein